MTEGADGWRMDVWEERRKGCYMCASAVID